MDGWWHHFTAIDGDEAVDDAGDGADGAEQDEVHEAASRGVQIEQAFLAYFGAGCGGGRFCGGGPWCA